MDIDAQQPRNTQPLTAAVAQAANEPRVLALGALLDTAKGLEHLLGRALEREFGISLAMFEVLVLLGQADSPLPMRQISQARLLTSGGATRLIDRMQAAGLVNREVLPRDERVHLVTLTASGKATLVRAGRRHADNAQRHMLDPLPCDGREAVLAAVARLNQSTRIALQPTP